MPPPTEAPPRHRRQRVEGVHVRPRNEAAPQSEPRELMPMEVARQQFIDAIRSHNTVVVRGGTGSGKSTAGSTIALEALQIANPGKRVKMMVAEPRQILAETVSRRVAELNNVPWGGDLVGYYHGDGQKYSKEKTQIVYTVNGSLKNRIKEDLSLHEWDAIFLDEIHLRDPDQEAILIGSKEVQKERHKRGLPPLKIFIASASAQQKHADYYDNSFMLEVAGEEPKYHVDKVFSETVIDPQKLPLEVARLAAEIIQDETHYGDVVSFLPGRPEIKIAQTEFDRIMREKGLADIYKSASLTGGGGQANKAIMEKLGDKDPNRNPIAAFATKVAEAGATFPRLTKVISSGQSRVMVYDEQSGLERLETRGYSYDDYLQQLGRLARVADGEFHGMFPEADLTDESKHPKEAPPSILIEDIVPLVLGLKTMNIIDVHNIDYIDHPGKEKLDKAVETLTLLGALNPDGTLTDEGKEMAELPTDPHFARMLVEAKKRGCVEAVSVLVGFLNSNRSVFAFNPRTEQFQQKYGRYIDPESDYLTLLKVWNASLTMPREEWDREKEKFSDRVFYDATMAKNDLMSEDLFEELHLDRSNKAIDLSNSELVLAINQSIAVGLTDRLLIRGQNNTYDLINGRRKGIFIDRSSVFAQNPVDMFVSGRLRALDNGSVYAGMNQLVTEELIREVAPYVSIAQQEASSMVEASTLTEPEVTPPQTQPEADRPLAEATPTPPPQVQRPRNIENPIAIKTLVKKIGKAVSSFVKGIKEAVKKVFNGIKRIFRRK